MNICVNPSCSNVETFGEDVCPLCGDVCTVDTLTYMKALEDRDAMTEMIAFYHLDERESRYWQAA